MQVATHSFLPAAAMVTLFFKDIARLSSSASCVAGAVGSEEITIFLQSLPGSLPKPITHALTWIQGSGLSIRIFISPHIWILARQHRTGPIKEKRYVTLTCFSSTRREFACYILELFVCCASLACTWIHKLSTAN